MKPRHVLTVVVVALAALILLLNWSTLLQSARLNLLVASVDAPLGVILLIVAGALALAYLIAAARLEVRAGLEASSLRRELELARQLAEKNEASRLAELRGYLQRELAAVQAKLDRLIEHRGQGGPGAGRI